jgi:hypothetical protein
MKNVEAPEGLAALERHRHSGLRITDSHDTHRSMAAALGGCA